MRIAQEFSGYNQRRYGRPWIAKVTSWAVGGRPEVEWGRYLGDSEGGECEIEAEVGDVVRWGQKDNRGGNTEANWGIVRNDGEIVQCTAGEAAKAWRDKTEIHLVVPGMDLKELFATISDENLIAEAIRRNLIKG